ncbi:hypothetical protein [Candidatus Hodgkinia cicadicola]|uniref:hypothetical protein n=1 Tax=Candidatus Hodgkinia cicadicola TaxID=573658 RepID=UPI001788CCDB
MKLTYNFYLKIINTVRITLNVNTNGLGFVNEIDVGSECDGNNLVTAYDKIIESDIFEVNKSDNYRR